MLVRATSSHQRWDIYWNGASDVKIDKKKAIYFYELGNMLNDYHCQEMLKKAKKYHFLLWLVEYQEKKKALDSLK